MPSVELLGLPYEGPEDFLRGTALAPSRLRWAMESIEDYSVYQQTRVPKFQDHGDLYVPSGPPAQVLETLFQQVHERVHPRSRWLFLGGNHAVTYVTVKALLDHFPDLHVVHLDAHLDRRDTFEGNRWSHACVIRRLEELLGPDRIHTFGYRSRAEEEPETGVPFEVFAPLQKQIPSLKGPLYLTIDLDVLDPSEFPAVTNPEPGGISFQELQQAIALLKGRLVAVDVVEYNPLSSPALFPAVTGALLVRELLITLAVDHPDV